MSGEHYTTTFTLPGMLRGEPVQVFGKQGLPGGALVGDAAALAADLVAPGPTERVALLGCGNGALGVALARQLPAGSLTLSDPSLIALRMARLTLAANGAAGAAVSEQVSLLPEGAGAFDRVIILTPQSRALGRRWLAEAQALLRPGGRLNLAGANGAGIQPLVGDAAALFGAAQTLGYGRGCRVAEAVRAEEPPAPPEWATAPGIAPGSWHTIEATLPGGPAELVSLPGLFSYDRIDDGTALLLQHMGPCAGLRVIDAGCGYGPIGVAAARLGAARVALLDASLPAIAAARENIARLGLSVATAAAGDALEAAPSGAYDLIASNPPFHAGKAVNTAMAAAFIAQARALLAPGGRLLLVANGFLPYERHLAPHFARVSLVAANRSYKVIAGEQ